MTLPLSRRLKTTSTRCMVNDRRHSLALLISLMNSSSWICISPRRHLKQGSLIAATPARAASARSIKGLILSVYALTRARCGGGGGTSSAAAGAARAAWCSISTASRPWHLVSSPNAAATSGNTAGGAPPPSPVAIAVKCTSVAKVAGCPGSCRRATSVWASSRPILAASIASSPMAPRQNSFTAAPFSVFRLVWQKLSISPQWSLSEV
mmetsp:Transcript_102964/g.295243  ORF Transcript_102964/g.295243 Transcript_102964/m.295243 type:complete len:209 (+) Transcript_102964:750-1376(+)